MKNKSLLTLLVFSSLIIPTLVSAGMTNERVELQGNLAIKGGDSITLGKDSGKSIQLNKGTVDIEVERLENSISLLTPRLYIEQNGQMLAIKVPAAKYLNEDDFELTADSSGLNYDLSLQKTTLKGGSFNKIEEEGCTFHKAGDSDSRIQFGVQKVQNTYITIQETYKLTLGKDNEVAAKITSSKIHTEKLQTKSIDICR
jgi:hypothetical protein